jgi:hypothetical protein
MESTTREHHKCNKKYGYEKNLHLTSYTFYIHELRLP